MYESVITFHIIVSSCFILTGAVLLSLTILGWLRGKQNRERLFVRFSGIFLSLLYIQFVTGLGLYFFLKPDLSASRNTLEEAMDQSALRFWAIEHVSLMIFALILSQIGWLFIRELQPGKKKYRAASLYYGTSFLVVLISAAMAIFR